MRERAGRAHGNIPGLIRSLCLLTQKSSSSRKLRSLVPLSARVFYQFFLKKTDQRVGLIGSIPARTI